MADAPLFKGLPGTIETLTALAEQLGQIRDNLAFGKRGQYGGGTIETLNALAEQLGQMTDNLSFGMRGQHGGGTWVHPDIGILCAMWLDKGFGLWCAGTGPQMRLFMEPDTGSTTSWWPRPTSSSTRYSALWGRGRRPGPRLASTAPAQTP